MKIYFQFAQNTITRNAINQMMMILFYAIGSVTTVINLNDIMIVSEKG